MNERIAYWLVPAEPHRARFAETIRELAARFDAPVFEPHVTIYTGPLAREDRPTEIIAEVRRGAAPMTLRATGIFFSERFTKTLFVEFGPSEPLTSLCENLRRQQREPAPYDLRPHLSLIYARLDSGATEGIARSLALPGEVLFDSIKAVGTSGVVRSRADVESWRVLAECALANG